MTTKSRRKADTPLRAKCFECSNEQPNVMRKGHMRDRSFGSYLLCRNTQREGIGGKG